MCRKVSGGTTISPNSIPGGNWPVCIRRVMEDVKKDEEKSMKKHEKHGKRDGYFRSVNKEDCKRGFRTKTIQDSIITTSLKCLQAKRLGRGKKMLEEMQLTTEKIYMWSDKKFLSVEAVVNYQNDRVYITSPENILKGVRTHLTKVTETN